MAAKDKDQEWWESFAYLSPEDQQATMAEMGYSPTGVTQDPGFEYFGGGLEDYPLEGVAATPEYTTKGALDPRDLTQVAKGINVAQDYGALLLDNILTGLAGPGSYDTSAFTPEIEYGKEVTRPGEARLQSYAQRGGWEGFIANEIMNGGTPSSAMASLQQFLETTDPEDPELDDQERAAYQSLVNSLPRNREAPEPGRQSQTDLGFWGDYDYDTLYNTAAEYSDAVFKDPGFGWQDPESGRYYDQAPEEIKTPQMEFFDKYGLPYPTASYNDPKYLDAMLDAEEGTTREGRQAEAQGYERGYADVVGQRERAEAAVREGPAMEDQMRQAWEASQGPAPGVQRTGPADNPYSLPPASMDAARQAAELDLQAMLAKGTGVPTRDTYLDQAMARADLQPQAGLGTSASNRGRGASTEAANVAADLDYERAMEEWRAEQEARLLDEAMTRGATARLPAQKTPMSLTLPDGRLGLFGARTEPQQGEGRGFGAFKPGVATADPEFNPFTFITKAREQTAPLTAKTVSKDERYKRSRATNDKAVAARQRQQATEGADPRLNDIQAAAQLFWLAKQGRTPLSDAVGQRRLGASRLGL